MRERLAGLEDELRDVEIRLADPDVRSDPPRLAELGRRHKELTEIVGVARRLDQVDEDLAAWRTMLAGADGDERRALQDELGALEDERAALEARLADLLAPRHPNDERNVILEIRGAVGGEEANLFARDLFEMYRGYARRRGWSIEVLSASPSDRGGYSEISALVAGEGVWSRLRHEAGIHRVQRVPVTESQGRLHTSAATVSVLPEADEVDVEIDDADLQIDVFRASGPGGQSVNTTDSAVRITHLPTGVTVSMQDEKSQLQNRQKALRVLRSRLLQLEQERAEREMSALRRDQIGGGDRSGKIRTYNFRENRVTDHRVGLTLHKLDRVLAGDLDEIVDALLADQRRAELSGGPVAGPPGAGEGG